MRLAANLSTQFAAGPWPERVAQAAAAGFKAVEAQWPYAECEARDLADALNAHGLTAELVNAPVGSEDRTRLGYAAVSGAEESFRASIDEALAYAAETGFRRVHVLCGAGPATSREVLLGNLTWASTRVGDDAVLVIEAINRQDVPGYHLAGIGDAVDVLSTLDRPNLRLMFDFYHAWRNGEDIVRNVEAHADWIAHVQISDHPGRGEPGSGEIDFRPGLAALRRVGYVGAVGCEFRPTRAPADCLEWAEALGFELGSGGGLSR